MSVADDAFETLLDEALADPEGADYARLRRAYPATSGYLPFGRDQEAVEELHMRIATQAWQPAADLAQELLATDPLAITLRFAYALILDGLREEWEAGFQRAFADGLLRCILRSGDGRTPATALVVLDAREVELVLGVLGLTAEPSGPGASSQGGSLREIDGRWVHVVEARGRGGARTVYFDVDWPQRWLRRQSA